MGSLLVDTYQLYLQVGTGGSLQFISFFRSKKNISIIVCLIVTKNETKTLAKHT